VVPFLFFCFGVDVRFFEIAGKRERDYWLWFLRSHPHKNLIAALRAAGKSEDALLDPHRGLGVWRQRKWRSLRGNRKINGWYHGEQLYELFRGARGSSTRPHLRARDAGCGGVAAEFR